MNKLVSIIIPCYNYAHFLSEAVQSVLQQSYTNIECIIVNDGSPDNTEDVALQLKATDSRVVYFKKQNGGLSSARNFGIEKAKGDFICFLDADDLMSATKIETQLACFQQATAADIVYGDAMFFEHPNLKQVYNSKSKLGAYVFARKSGSGKEMLSHLLRENFTVVSAPLLKRSVIEKVGLFDVRYKSYEDWQFWTRCALAGCNFQYCPQAGVCTLIRFGYESMMSDEKKMLKAGIQFRTEMNGYLMGTQKIYNSYRLLKSKLKLALKK